MDIGNLAARIHEAMCRDERFGYSWAERWGGPETDTWDFDGREVTLNVGDYDCSSSTVTAWRKAVEGTPYEGCFDAATYTGNMRSVFCGSGLFDWVGVDEAEPGDLYLNEACHVAMCQGGGALSEFSSSETGGIYGQRGDQTGWESHVAGYYSYPWDGCLHYNGAADTDERPREKEFDLKRVYNNGGAVYRLYNPNTGFHCFTLDKSERDGLKGAGWRDEGVAFETRRGGSDAVYRMYNPANGDHLYTVSYDEAEALQGAGWRYEGVPFFAWGDGAKVYRMYNPNSGEHFMTASASELRDLAMSGWKHEGTFTV